MALEGVEMFYVSGAVAGRPTQKVSLLPSTVSRTLIHRSYPHIAHISQNLPPRKEKMSIYSFYAQVPCLVLLYFVDSVADPLFPYIS